MDISLYLYHKATTALQKLSSWLNANKLLANSSKSNYIIFAPKNIHLTLSNQLEMNNTVLERVSNTKFLGVYLDTQLSWHTHVHETTLKIYRKIPILYRLRYIFPIKTMLTLYHSFIHSHITYAIQSKPAITKSRGNEILTATKYFRSTGERP